MIEPPGPHDPDDFVMKALFAACPSFADRWSEHVASSDGRIGPYVNTGAFAGHVADLLVSDETSEFPAVVEAVERVLTDGDDGVRYLVTYGLVESLQNVAADRGGWALAALFRHWLHPKTVTAWARFTRCGARPIRGPASPVGCHWRTLFEGAVPSPANRLPRPGAVCCETGGASLTRPLATWRLLLSLERVVQV